MSERKKHIAVLKEMLEWMNMSSEVIKKDDPFFIVHEHRKKAVKYAISSLETDEAYQLEYEKPEFCEDCIPREVALRINELHHGQMPNHINHQIWKELKAVPPVTPIRPKGHWIGNYQVDFGEWQEYDVKLSDGFVTDNCHCSECGEELLSGDRGMFCPYCGADMRGEE